MRSSDGRVDALPRSHRWRSIGRPISWRINWPIGWRRTLLLVLVAVAARVAYWMIAIPHYHPISDAGQYSQLASSVAHGKGVAMYFPALTLHPSAFRPPVYPLLLGFWYFVFGASVGAGQALSLVTGVGAVLVTERLANRLAGSVAGLVAALAVAVCVPLVADDVTLLTESLSMLLLAASLLFLVQRRPVLAGLTSGLLILTRPSAQGLAVVAALWLWWTIGWRRALHFLGVVVVLFGAWVIRNEIQLGSPVTFTSNGFNFAAMYSEPAQQNGGFVDPVVDQRFDDLRLVQFDEVKWSHTLTNRGIAGIEHDPLYVFDVIGRNSESWFELVPTNGDPPEHLDGRNLTARHWALPEFYVFTIGGIAGLVVTRKKRNTVLLIAVSLYFTAASLVLLAPPRVRAPFDLINCVGLGLLAAWWWQRRHQIGGSSENETSGEQAAGGERGDAVQVPMTSGRPSP